MNNRPNILIFMTDQQRGDTIPPYSLAKTPNLDRFCNEGLTFTRTYCSSPHCSPSRASFLSGLYPSQHGVWNNVDVGNTLSKGFYEDVRLWSEDLRDAGYGLYFTGKWHVSHHETPMDRGWELIDPEEYPRRHTEEYTILRKPDLWEWEAYKKGGNQTQEAPRGEGEIKRFGYINYTHYGEKENPFRDREIVENALDKIRTIEATGEPWCMYIGTSGPHDPYFAPEKYLEMYSLDDIQLPENFSDDLSDKPNLYKRTRMQFDQLTEREHKEAIRHYLAVCSFEDAIFGKLLDALEETGQKENTLVLYTSDHGDYMAEHGLWCKGLPCFQPAYHIPAAVRWPKGIVNPGRSEDAFVSITDFAATFLEVAGVAARRTFTGQSLFPFLKNEIPVQWRDEIFTQSNGNELYGIQRSVMTREWKYVYNGFDFDELYDLQKDPGETVNLINEPDKKAVVKEMCQRLWRFAYETGDVCINQYVMVAHAPYGPGIIFDNE